MIEKTALTLAERWVKLPQKAKNGDWVVKWLDRTIVKSDSFVSLNDANMFYYTKIQNLKNKIINNGKQRK
jgi:hypothetical protein